MYSESFEGVKVDFDDAKENMALREWMRQDQKVCGILTFRMLGTTLDARRHYEEVMSRGGYSALAIVVTNPVTRMIANFSVGFVRPKAPVKVFASMDDAKCWVEGLRERGVF